MNHQISSDIQSVIDWEIANRDNAIEEVLHPFKLPVVVMIKPLVHLIREVPREVPDTLTWWVFRDPHYGPSEWCAGYESSVSGHKVCGPLP